MIYSEPHLMFQMLTAYLHSRPERLLLKLCCVSKLNNVKMNKTNFPIVYGIGKNIFFGLSNFYRCISMFQFVAAYNIKTKTVFKCNKFEYKGPDLAIRYARYFTDSGVSSFRYDSAGLLAFLSSHLV
jgi:hypothetical protein